MIEFSRIASNGVIKISDFGLTKDVHSRNYFRQVKDGAKLPLKWMALESIKSGVFSEKSDVVSPFVSGSACKRTPETCAIMQISLFSTVIFLAVKINFE